MLHGTSSRTKSSDTYCRATCSRQVTGLAKRSIGVQSDSGCNDQLSASESALVDLGLYLFRERYCFSTITPATHARVIKNAGHSLAKDLRGVFGWSLPFEPGLVPNAVNNLMRRADILRPLEGGMLRSTVRFSTLNGSIFVHSAFPTIEADAVFFGPDTVRFVAAIDSWLGNQSWDIGRVADIGCGGGAGGIAVARRHPRAAVYMLDINDKALSASRVNAALNGVLSPVCRKSDVLAAVQGSFDLIISNPPYLFDRFERAYRHGGGKFGEGLSLRILQDALPRLSEGGTILLYTGAAVVEGVNVFRASAEYVVAEQGLEAQFQEVDPDVFGEELDTPEYAGVERIAAMILTVTRSSKR
jgi:methylase of polypeptide subunit release factors